MRKYLLLLGAVLCLAASLPAQTVPTPSQTDQIILDNNSNSKADPGDKIRYKVTVQNTGSAPATGVQLNVNPDNRTTLDLASFRTSPVATNDGPYACTGNVGISVSAASGVKINDFDDNLNGITLTIGTQATNGIAAISNDGSFTYTPNAGFTGTDQFTYVMTDATPVSGHTPAAADVTGTVSITVSNLIWFIDNSSVAATSDGRRASPFKSLADFNAGSTAAGSVVYIEHTGTNYTGGIVLQNGERLFGEGHTGGANLADVLPFSLASNSNSLPNINGTRPVLSNAAGDGVTLAQNNTLNGFNIGTCSGNGLFGATFGTLDISNLSISTTGQAITLATGTANGTLGSVTSSGGTNNVLLNAVVCNLNLGSGALSGATGRGFYINGGSGTIAYSGTISNSLDQVVHIRQWTSGTATLSGNITATGNGMVFANNTGGTINIAGASKSLNVGANTGVSITNNTGATINFTNGGLVITTTSGTGYNATGGGTINVTGAGNTIASTTGLPLNVTNTTIGASNLNFQSISANGAPNGIVLNTTGTTGGLVVTGTGSTNGSGGTIQNITNRGVSATGTANLSLSNMIFNNANTADASPCGSSNNSGCNAAIYINNSTNAALNNVDIDGAAQQGINLTEVNGFQLLNSTVINGGMGGQTEEADLYAINLFGTCAINGSSLTVPAERAAVIYNTSKTMTLTVNGSTFGMNQTQPLGADGLEINSYGASNTTLNVVNSTFVEPKTNGLQVITENTSVSNVNVSGSTFNPGNGLAAAIDLATNSSGTLKFNILNNPSIRSRGINAVNVVTFGNSTATFEGRINNNTIKNEGGSGSPVRIVAAGDGNCKVEIKNNTVTGANDYGITTNAQQGSSRLDATITGNTVTVGSSGFYAIHAAAGASNDAFSNDMCINVAGNTTTAAPGAVGDFQARATTNLHEMMLQGGGMTVAANWAANLNTSLSVTPIYSQSTGSGGIFTFGATCLLPTNP